MDDEVKTPPTEPVSEAPKPKLIRNRDVDRKASALAEEHVLPIPPGKTLSWEQVKEYLALLTPAMWSHFQIYVYRLKPKIRRQLRDPNSPNSIDTLAEPFTLDYFISRHGGGKYQLRAVDNENKQGSNRELFTCLLEINDVQYPPILDYAELEMEARENKSYIAWLQNTGVLDGKGNVIRGQQPAAPPSAATNLSAKEVLDILGYAHKMNADQQAQFRQQFAPGEDSLSKSVGQILLEKMKQDDPGRDWDRMVAFMERMEKLNKPSDNGFAAKDLLQMQQQQRETDLAYTKLLLENTRTANTNTRSQFGEFREIIAFARELMGTGGGRRSNWDTGLEIARDVVLPGLQTLGTTITNIMALRNGQPVAPGTAAAAPAMQGAFDPYSNPNAARQYASTLNAQQPPPAPAAGPASAAAPAAGPAAGPENPLMPIFSQYGNLVVNALNNGTAGFDFADYVVGLLGTATHAMIAGQGEEALATTMLAIPEISIFGEQRVRQFVNEFVHYQEYLEQDQEPAEEPPIEPEVEMPKVYRPPQRAAAAAARRT